MPKKDFNNLKPWLSKLIKDSGLPIYKVANRADMSRIALYNWMSDISRPDDESFQKVIRVLANETGRNFSELLTEGYSTFTPRQEGRPRGSTGTSEVRARSK